jgi:small conductance mechanosensitive channel
MLRSQLHLLVLVCLVVLVSSLVGAAEPAGEEPPEPVTTADPQIPVDELELLLKPLTKDQLLTEADAWQGLVQQKVEQISRAEIAVKRENREIQRATEIQKEAEEAKDRLEEVEAMADQARETGDAEAITEAEKAAEQAREQMGKVRESIDEAADAAEKTAELGERVPEEVTEGLAETADAVESAGVAVEEVSEAVEKAKGKTGEALREAADETRAVTEEAVEATARVQRKTSDVAAAVGAAVDTETLEAKTAELDDAKEAKKESKVALLEQVAQLRDERTEMLDRFKAVVAALEVKTDENDSDTLAKIRDHRLYASAVSGIEVDVKDATSTWLATKGWLLSEEGGQRWAINILTFVGILIAAWIVSGIFSGLIHRAMKRVPGTSRLLEDFLVKAARWVVLGIGLIMALSALEVSIGPMLALVGAAGFVVAFALQDSLSNFANGLMILFFKPFDVGDVVDAGGVSGTVQSVSLVSTTIKTFDNKLMVVPNNKVWGDVITNATGVTERRVDMEFGIGYDDDIDRAQAILEEIVGAHPNVLQEPAPTIRMNTLGDSSVNFIVRPWAKTADYWGVFWDITREVKKRFDAEDIGIPYPQRDVHLYLEDAHKLAVLARPSDAAPPPPAPKSTDGGLDS